MEMDISQVYQESNHQFGLLAWTTELYTTLECGFRFVITAKPVLCQCKKPPEFRLGIRRQLGLVRIFDQICYKFARLGKLALRYQSESLVLRTGLAA